MAQMSEQRARRPVRQLAVCFHFGSFIFHLPSACRMAEMEVRQQAREPGLGCRCQKHSQPARPADPRWKCNSVGQCAPAIVQPRAMSLLGCGFWGRILPAKTQASEPGLASCVPDLAQIAGAGGAAVIEELLAAELGFFSLNIVDWG